MELVLRSAPTVDFGKPPHLEDNNDKAVVRDAIDQRLKYLPSLDGLMTDNSAPFPMRPKQSQPQTRNSKVEKLAS